MPYRIVVDGVVRQFELIAPVGWQHWVQAVYDDDNTKDGLPLLIMLHGTQAVRRPPTGGFLHQWRFHDLLDEELAPLADRFFILVPYGLSYLSATGADALPIRGWDSGLGAQYLSVTDDVAAIEAMISAAQAMLQAELTALGSTRAPFDENRIFAFGYSSGAMMCFKLANEKPGYFAGIFVIAGSYGGRAHDGYTSTVQNPPQGSTYALSLYALHGQNDTSLPPGDPGTPTGLLVASKTQSTFEQAGVPTADAEALASSFRPLAGTVTAFLSFHGMSATPDTVTTGLPDWGDGETPGTSSVERVWHGSGGNNPEIVTYRDGAAGHSGFTDVAVRYKTPTNVWTWFKSVPRTTL